MKVEHLAYDLFMLMLNLAQLKSKERVLTTFLETMNNLPVDLSFRLLSPDEPAPTGEVIEIATPQNSFGRILLEGSLVEQRHEFLTLIRNAVCMLAIILENQIRVQLLRREINERKQIEQELRQSEERLALAITGIGGALWDEELDPEATFDDLANNKVYHSLEEKKLLGYEEADEFPDSITVWDDHVLPEDRPLREKRQRDHFEGRTEFLDHEYRVRRKDGSVRWIQGRSRIIRDERGRPIRWIGLDWDITGRKQAEEELRRYREHLEELVKERTADLLLANEKLEQEIAEGLQTKEALRESKEKYRLLLENANEGIVVAQDELLKFFNSKVVEITGYSEAELLAKSFAGLIHPDDREMVVERHLRRLRGEHPPDTYSFRIMGRGDSIKWVELRAVLIDWEGKPATLNFLSNVTERRQTEEALTRSEATLRSIFRAAPTGIGLVSNRMLLQVNDRICQMSGYTRDELIGQNVRILLSDEEYEYVGREKYAQIRERGTGTVETRWQRKDGRVIDVLLSSTPLDPDDLSIGVTFTALDITDRKRAEAEIRQLNEELEQRVIERTAQLEAVNQELKEFAYMVSHDLKAPLRAISQLANWLLVDHADALDQEGQELLGLIISRTKRMHNLIEGILQYSRIGRITERERNVDLNLLVQETIEMLAPPEHIQITIEEPLPTVLGERTRFEQVFQNLLSNAIKFIDKPKGQIRINCIDEKTHWCFSVADNGPGIEERYYAKIFQVFQTLSPRDKVESTGIGLALVKKIVETWGGKIWLESTVGQGSTFLFTLPRKGKQDGEER